MKCDPLSTIADAARVLSRYLDGIVIRTFKQSDVEQLAANADIPVINALTDLLHPCQIMSDILTVYEKLGRYEDFKLVYIGDGNNITNSWLNLSTLLGIELVVATSPDTLPDMQVYEHARNAGPSRVSISHDPISAVRGAHVIYTDVWASMGQKDQFLQKEKALQPFQVNQALVSKADKDCLVMHCLPAERGHEITDEVMDGPHSVVFDEAENRLETDLPAGRCRWIFSNILLIHTFFHRVEVSHGRALQVPLRLPEVASVPGIAYSLGSLLPSSRLAKRVELWRKARLNLPIGPLRCLAMMISARPLRSGSSCL